ncbi:MAG: STAS domain-containing protein [Mariprofundaceae bacterium]
MGITIDVSEERQSENEVLLRINGEVNIHTSTELRKRLKPLLTEQQKTIHVALDGVHFMDSSGIATLIEGLQWSRETGGKFVLSGLTDTVRDVFILSKLDTVFEIEDDEPAA